jgi:hypothetical protein
MSLTFITKRCTVCGGLVAGEPEDTFDFWCICRMKLKEEPEPHLMGWECPRCHKIHSPFVTDCECKPLFFTTADFVTTPIKPAQT